MTDAGFHSLTAIVARGFGRPAPKRVLERLEDETTRLSAFWLLGRV